MAATAQPLFATGPSLPQGQALPMIGRTDGQGNYATAVERWVMVGGVFVPAPVDANGNPQFNLAATNIVLPNDQQSIMRTLQIQNTTPLGANAIYTSASVDGLNYRRVTGVVYSDQASATNGFVIQNSDDGTTWDTVYQQTVSAATPLPFDVVIYKRYVLVKLTNGGTAETTLRLSVYTCPV